MTIRSILQRIDKTFLSTAKTLALAGGVVSAGLAASQAGAHHSFSMFADEAIAVSGEVLEFKFTNPHTFLLIEIENEDGTKTVWNLEGSSPNGLIREGWRSDSIQPGEILNIHIRPLRSGAHGGSWAPVDATREDGSPIVVR